MSEILAEKVMIVGPDGDPVDVVGGVLQTSGGGASGTVEDVAAADGSIVIGGTPTVHPTVRTGTLDAIATAHPPVAAVAMNGQKITGLANGAAASDAAAFGQIPAALPPSGAAGGVLSGSYPNPGFAVDMATQAELDAAVATLVPKSLYDAATLLVANVDNTPLALSVPASTFVGRKASGDIAAMSATEAAALLTSLVPKSLYDANTVLAATSDDTPAAVTMGASTILARLASGNIKAASTAEINSLLQTSSRQQLAQTAMGEISSNFSCLAVTNSSSPATQIVYGTLLGFKAGDVVTGVMLRNNTSAAGTAPTLAKVCIASSAGVVLALSGDVGAAATWGNGPVLLPFTSPYTVLTDGGFYVAILVNGTWGTTQPAIVRSGGSGAAGLARAGFAAPAFSWTGQTDLPAVAASLTISAVTVLAFWMGAY